MAKKKTQKSSSLLNQEIDLLTTLRGQGLTVGVLKALLSYYPDHAKVLLQNLNGGYIPTAGITATTGVNATEQEKERVFVMEDEGPINAVVLGFWDECGFDIEYGPKQQVEIDAAVARMTKRAAKSRKSKAA